MVFILVDHISPNVVSELTPKNFGFSDMAEVFVFASGISCGIAYGRRYRRKGFLACQWKALCRIFQIYLAYVATALVLTAIDRLEQRGTSSSGGLFTYSWSDLVLMSRSSGALPILQLYMMLLLVTPLLVVCCGKGRWATLLGSLLLYLAVQLSVLYLNFEPPLQAAFLEPFAWQFLFIAGLAAGAFRDAACWPPSHCRVLVLLSLLVIESAFLAKVLWASQAIPLIDKETLGPLRVVHFLALATVAGAILSGTYREWIERATAFRVPAVLGQNALFAFCASEVIAAFSNWIVESGHYHTGLQVAVTLGAIFALYAATVSYHVMCARHQAAVEHAGRAVLPRRIVRDSLAGEPE